MNAEVWKRRARQHLNPDWVVLSSYTLATLVLTTPLIFHLQDNIGGRSPDSFQNFWNLWWTLHATIIEPANPFYTRFIYYPDGVSLLFHTLNLTNGLLAIPFHLAFGGVAADNLIVLTAFVLTGYTGYLLARDIIRQRASAFLAGFILTFSPFHIAKLWGGQMQMISLQWLPLFLFFFLRTIRHGRLRDILITAFFFCWIALTDWYYFLYAGLAAGIFLFVHLVQRASLFPSRTRPHWDAPRRWIAPLVALGLGLALLIPLLSSMLQEAAASPYVYPAANDAVKFSADLAAFFIPSSLHPMLGPIFRRVMGSFYGGLDEFNVYLGVTPIVLMVFAVFRHRHTSAPWLLTLFVSILLALGPVIHIFGQFEFGSDHTSIPGPYGLLIGLPLLTFARTIIRFVALAMLSLSILAGFGMSQVLRIRPGTGSWRRIRLGTLIFGLIYFEYLAVPIPLQAIAIPKYAEIQAHDSTVTGVLDLPSDPYLLDAFYMVYQSAHQKPIVGGYVSRPSPHVLVESLPFWPSWVGAAPVSKEIIIQPPGVGDLELLKALGISDIVIHTRWWPKYFSEPNPVRADLEALEPIYRDQDEVVYSLRGVQPPRLAIFLDGDWYPAETNVSTGETFRWLVDDGSVGIWASEPQKLKLDLSAWSFDTPRHVELYVNGQLLQRVSVPSDDIRAIATKTFQVPRGLNWVRFHPVEKAVSPKQVGSGDDERRLAVAVEQISFTAEPDAISR